MLTFTEAQLMAWISPVLWPFLRVLGLFTTSPIFSSRAFPIRARVGLAFMVALCAQATLPPREEARGAREKAAPAAVPQARETALPLLWAAAAAWQAPPAQQQLRAAAAPAEERCAPPARDAKGAEAEERRRRDEREAAARVVRLWPAAAARAKAARAREPPAQLDGLCADEPK